MCHLHLSEAVHKSLPGFFTAVEEGAWKRVPIVKQMGKGAAGSVVS